MSRLFVCDPACVQPFGHNVTALRYFRDSFQDEYQSAFAVCCNLLPKHVAVREDFTSFFRFYYHRYFPAVIDLQDEDARDDVGSLQHIDRMEFVASEDAERLLATFEIGPDDHILFPHLDFYGVAGMLNALDKRQPDLRPKLFLRFIGVMENATPTYRSPLDELLARITLSLERGQIIRFGAETPRYADLLASKLGALVTVTGYPDTSEQMQMDVDGPFVFYCPGSARHDKGFADLLSIFKAVRNVDPDLSIRFITQILPDLDLAHQLWSTSQLYALPGVELQPSSITAEEMIATYRRSHAVLLPYATDVYELRGSAVLMEAASYGRPAITFEGTAFAELVRYYNLGHVVPDRGAMVEAILRLAETDRTKLQRAAMQGRHRFHCDNVSSYRSWLDLR